MSIVFPANRAKATLQIQADCGLSHLGNTGKI